MTTLTAAQAQALHAAAVERGTSPMWFVCTDPAHPGRVQARAYVETHAGGELLGPLVAGSLDELRAMLPAGMNRHERAPVDPPEVVEM